MSKTNPSQAINVDIALQQLLQLIRTITKSDAGTIYLKDKETLLFKIFQNDSISDSDLKKKNIDISSIKLSLKEKHNLVAVKSCNEMRLIKIDNVYINNDFDLSGTKEFDTIFHYKTNSMLTLPLLHPFSNEVIGVLQVINKKAENQDLPYTEEDEKALLLISSFISMAILNVQNYVLQLETSNIELKKQMAIEMQKSLNKNTLLFHSYKISQMNEMIQNISHQWRNPLGELGLNNMMLQMKIEGKEVQEILTDNNKIIQKLSNTINSFQIIFDGDSIEMNKFNLKRTINDVLMLIDIYTKSYNIVVLIDIDENSEIFGKLNDFSHIILAILQNFIEIIKKQKIHNSKITISTVTISENINIELTANIGIIDEKMIQFLKTNQQNFLGIEVIKLLLEYNCKGKLFVDIQNNDIKYTMQLPTKYGCKDAQK